MVTPDRGDLIWIDFDPARGHEQQKHRPAIVLSAKDYSIRSGLILVCPITSVQKGYPFEVPVQYKQISGVILSDQIRSVDWRDRGAKRIGKCKPEIITAVLQKLRVLVE